jgi:hypothetical protein
MKRIVLIVCCAFGFSVFAQQTSRPFSEPNKLAGINSSKEKRNNNANPLARNAIYIEIFGSSGAYYNVGYDRLLVRKDKMSFRGIVGFQYNYLDGGIPDEGGFSFAPQMSFLYGNKHHLELGVGLIYQLGTFTNGTFRVGYRFQKPAGGFLFKVGFTPIYFPKGFFGSPILPWGGIAFGYAF